MKKAGRVQESTQRVTCQVSIHDPVKVKSDRGNNLWKSVVIPNSYIKLSWQSAKKNEFLCKLYGKDKSGGHNNTVQTKGY